MDAMITRKRIWRAWLRMERGGLMGVPYPADNETRAKELAHKAEECFGGRCFMWRRCMNHRKVVFTKETICKHRCSG